MKSKLKLFLLNLILCLLLINGSYSQNLKVTHPGPDYSYLLQKYDVLFYDLNLQVERNSNFLAGDVLIKVKAMNDLDTFAFQLHDNLVIDSILINGKKAIAYLRKNGYVKVVLPSVISKNSFILADIFYRGYPPNTTNSWGQGFINRTDDIYHQQITFSLSCPYFAYEWFPCKQDLYDHADSVYINVITDTSNKVASNGLLKKVVELGNGKHRFEWQTHYPINYYLIFISVAQYIEYDTSVMLPGASKPLLIQNFIYPNALANVKEALDYSPDFLRNYSSKYGLYPFINEKFGTYMAPISGGMEHQTMTLMGSLNVIDKYLNAHEMAHQWFGDALTIGTFRDVWLSEGFATYSELVSADSLFPSESLNHLQTDQSEARSFARRSIYRSDTSTFDSIYNTHTVYEKGMAVMHMIRFIVNNDTQFYHILKEYFTIYKFKNVTVPAFKSYLEARSKKDFTAFFNQWYYGVGFPVYTIRWNQVGSTLGIKSIRIRSSVTHFTYVPIEYTIKRDIGDTTLRLDQLKDTQFFYFKINGTISDIKLDTAYWILHTIKTIKKDASMKINGNGEHGMNYYIYPNPGHDYIEIVSNDRPLRPITDSGIYNINGKLLKNISVGTTKSPVNISDLKPGVYYLKISENDQSGYSKFIKL